MGNNNNENFQSRPAEADVTASDTKSAFINELREATDNSQGVSKFAPGEMIATIIGHQADFQRVSDFISDHMGKDGKLNLEKVSTKEIQDILDLNQKQVDALSGHKGKVVANLDVQQVNLKQFG